MIKYTLTKNTGCTQLALNRAIVFPAAQPLRFAG